MVFWACKGFDGDYAARKSIYAVMIDSGEYLWGCLRYIDLNMVRAGVVRNPAEWAWCGYQEMAGLRKRYRVVNQAALSAALAPGQSWAKILEHYKESVLHVMPPSLSLVE